MAPTEMVTATAMVVGPELSRGPAAVGLGPRGVARVGGGARDQ